MKSRFTYVGETVVEVIVNGESLTWNVLAPKRSLTPEPSTAPSIPAAPPESGADSADAPGAAPDSPRANGPESDLGAISAPPVLSEPTYCAAPPLTRKRRSLMAIVRAAWMIIFSFVGEAAVYVLDNLTNLNLPPGTGVAVGAVCYGLKRYVKPEGLL